MANNTELPSSASEAKALGFEKVDRPQSMDFGPSRSPSAQPSVGSDVFERSCQDAGEGGKCFESAPDADGKRIVCYCSNGNCDDCYREP